MSLRIVSQSNDAVIIDTNNLSEIKYNKFLLDIPIHWHKFIIEDVHGLKRNVILKIIFDNVKPLDLIPLCYTEQGKGAFFFARMCRHAIEKFCTNNLIIKNPYNINRSFKLKIILKYTSTEVVKVDLSENVLAVLHKRFKSPILCLNNFSEDPGLSEFFMLSQPRILAFVLNLAKNFKPNSIKLCNNEIQTLDAFKIMPGNSMVSLDLRHNMIKDLIELKYLEHLDITELWLEGNPLCQLYDEYSYVQQVIKYCPKIEKIDGFLLRQNGVPSFRRNFLCNTTSYDIIDNFLQQYFPSYDARNFTMLESFYHKNAMFSMTTNFLESGMTSSNFLLIMYRLYSRNVLNRPNKNENFYYGSSSVIKFFNLLPRLEHDPYSFTVDVLYYSNKSTIFVVTGVFREVPNIESMFGFNRCFVLECCDGNYKISNEQMHIFNALASQQVTAFKKPHVIEDAKNPAQKNQMINTFAVITNLTKELAKLFLEECHYNLKHAMILFVDLHQSDKIPLEGFQSLD